MLEGCDLLHSPSKNLTVREGWWNTTAWVGMGSVYEPQLEKITSFFDTLRNLGLEPCLLVKINTLVIVSACSLWALGSYFRCVWNLKQGCQDPRICFEHRGMVPVSPYRSDITEGNGDRLPHQLQPHKHPLWGSWILEAKVTDTHWAASAFQLCFTSAAESPHFWKGIGTSWYPASGKHLVCVKYNSKFISSPVSSVLKCCSNQQIAASWVDGLRKLWQQFSFWCFFKGKKRS